MHPLLKWLIGLRQLPQEAGEGAWHLELHSLPQGMQAVLAIAGAAGAVALIWLLYRWEGRSLGAGVRVAISSLRLLALACLTLMLCDLVLVIDRRERMPSNLLVLVDTSESMVLTDPYDDATARHLADGLRAQGMAASEGDIAAVRDQSRLDLARQALAPMWPDLQQGRQVDVYGFDSKARLMESKDPLGELQARGASTAIGDAMNQALAAHRGQPLAGILVVSDGQSNSGEDPRKIAQQSGREGTMIQTFVVGSEHGPSNARLSDIEVSPVVFVRDPLQIGVMVESQGMQGRSARVTLERRQAGEDWTEISQTDVSLGEDGQIQRVPFSYVPEVVGQYEFRARTCGSGRPN